MARGCADAPSAGMPYRPLSDALGSALARVPDGNLGKVIGPSGHDIAAMIPELELRMDSLGIDHALPETQATEQRVRLRWTRRRHWQRRRRRGWWRNHSGRLRVPRRVREFQQHSEHEHGSERTRWRDVWISGHGGHNTQWRRWRDLLALAKTLPGSRTRWKVVVDHNRYFRHLPMPRARSIPVLTLCLGGSRSRIESTAGRQGAPPADGNWCSPQVSYPLPVI